MTCGPAGKIFLCGDVENGATCEAIDSRGEIDRDVEGMREAARQGRSGCVVLENSLFDVDKSCACRSTAVLEAAAIFATEARVVRCCGRPAWNRRKSMMEKRMLQVQSVGRQDIVPEPIRSFPFPKPLSAVSTPQPVDILLEKSKTYHFTQLTLSSNVHMSSSRCRLIESYSPSTHLEVVAGESK